MTKYYDTADEAIENAVNDHEEPVINFEGMNCNFIGQDKECEGWDKVSKRCHCQNKRVAWTAAKNDGRWFAYAEAY
jgi:hypothetical protein